MEQMTAVKFAGVTFRNFRNHKEPENYQFGDLTYITGNNGTGKTTMAHGIVYALYGVSYYGEQNIDRMMSEDANSTEVQLDFVDQNGNAHTLVRSRKGDKTSIALDSYTIRQTDIDHMFCGKETFLAMFNPTYLIENMDANDGRDLVLKHLSPIPEETVLDAMSENYRRPLDGIAIGNPSETVKNFKDGIRRTENQLMILEGQMDTVEQTIQTSEGRLDSLYCELNEIKQKLTDLKAKQFDGIDLDDLTIRRDMLVSKLSDEPSGKNDESVNLKVKLEQAKNRQYESKFREPMAELTVKIGALSKEYKMLCERIQNLKAGTKCPTCFMSVTADNLPGVKAGLVAQINAISKNGKELTAQRTELQEYMNKEKETFDRFKAEDIARLTQQLEIFEQQAVSAPKRSEIQNAIEEIDETTRCGTLSFDEISNLTALEAEIIGIEAQIKTLTELSDENQLENLTAEKAALDDEITKYQNIIASLVEFILKRTELAIASIQMPNTKIKLYDVVRSTGEVKSVFKFTYKDRNYETLSLSEKTLAGIEVAAMIRKATGIDCPICIDNTESIGQFNAVSMPLQTLLLRFIKGQALAVQFRGNQIISTGNDHQVLEKAG